MSTDLYQKLKDLALAYVKVHDEPDPQYWAPENSSKYRSEDCIQSLHPKESIPAPFDEAFGQEQYHHALHFFGGVISKSKFEVEDIVIDVEQRKVVVSINAKLDLKAVGDEPEEKEWPASYVWIIKMDSDAEKIVRVDETIDAGRLMEHVRPKAEKYAQMK